MRPTSNPEPSSRPNRHRRWRRCLFGLFGFAALLLGLFVFRVPILIGAAEAWVVNEPAAEADAIVVLGGGPENRPFAAARLFHEGAAPRIVYTDVLPSPAEEIGVALPEKELTRRILLSNSVPETALTVIGSRVSSTYDEAQAVRAWLDQSGAKSIVIPTDLFHTRRVRWLFKKQLRNTPTELHIVAINPRNYGITNWWQHEEGLISFQNEIIKSLYYRIKY